MPTVCTVQFESNGATNICGINIFIGLLNGALYALHLVQLKERNEKYTMGSEEFLKFPLTFPELLLIPTWLLIWTCIFAWTQGILGILYVLRVKCLAKNPPGDVTQFVAIIFGLVAIFVPFIPWAMTGHGARKVHHHGF